MKILHLVQCYTPAYRYGGPIKSVHELNKWLVRRGIEVAVYTTNIDGPYKLDVPLNQEVIIDGVKVYYFPIIFRPWQYSFSLHRALAKNLKYFDAVHITSVFLSASTLGAYYAKKFNKPYVISPRGSLMKEPLQKKSSLKKRIYISLFEKRNLKAADAIHFTVEAEKDEYLKAGLPLKKGIVIPNGLDLEEFKEITPSGAFRKKWNIDSQKKVVLFLSRLNWKKGLDTLIPAFAEVVEKEPKAILAIVGNDDEGYRKKVEFLISNFQLKDKVIFTGMLLGKDKLAAFRESDVFVLPSYAENFGMAVLEAMYLGLPVIITKNVGIAPSVSRGGAGIVVNKDEKEVSEAILKILNNPSLAKKMGQCGRQLVQKEFSPVSVAEKFVELYNEL